MKKLVFRHPITNKLCIEEVYPSGKLVDGITLLHDTAKDGAIPQNLLDEFNTDESAEQTKRTNRKAKRAAAKAAIKEKMGDWNSVTAAQLKQIVKKLIEHMDLD